MSVLGVVVTLFGFCIAAFSLVFLTRGEKVPGGGSQPQKIEFKGFQLTTDRIGLLVFIGTIAMVGPFASFVYLAKSSGADTAQCHASESELKREVSGLKADLKRKDDELRDQSVALTARLENEKGEPLE